MSNTLNEAYYRAVYDVWTHGRWVDPVLATNSITSNFGERPKASRELVGHTFVVQNPRARLLTLGAHAANERFVVANFLWMLSGRDDHAWIGQYNDKGAGLAVDGHYPGAHGRRIGPQLRRVIDLLKEDPTSRRAVLQVSREEDLFTHSRDIPCVLALQFFVRDGRVELVVHMRSQNLLRVFPYDFYAFSMFQEVIAACLGLGVGMYTHQVGSLHFFEGDEDLVSKILDGDCNPSPTMWPIPYIKDLDEVIFEVMHHASGLTGASRVYWQTMLDQLAVPA